MLVTPRVRAWEPLVRYTPDRNDRPDILNRYLALKLHLHVLKAVPLFLSASGCNPNEGATRTNAVKSRKVTGDEAFSKARFSFSEKLSWLEPRLGYVPLTDKEIAGDLAIGGLRNAPASVARWTRTRQRADGNHHGQ